MTATEAKHEPKREFECQDCKDAPCFKTPDEVRAHLAAAHGLHLPVGQPAKRRLVMHGDGRDHYVYVYAWKFVHVTVVETQTFKRR